jgi:hypothetical protein
MWRCSLLGVLLCVFIGWGCADETVASEPDLVFEEIVVDDDSGFEEGKSDVVGMQWEHLEGFTVPARLLEAQNRRVMTSAVAFEQYFGVVAPESIDFSTHWVVFFSPGRNEDGVRADIQSIRWSSSMKSLLITTLAEKAASGCAQALGFGPTDSVVATFEFPKYLRAQSVRYFPLKEEVGCEAACEDGLKEALEEATADLWYTSESDYPFEYVEFSQLSSLDEVSPEALAQAAGIEEIEPFEERDFDGFFAWIARDEDDDMDDWDREETARYRALRDLLRSRFDEVRIFRLADIEVQVFILGVSPCGHVVGLHTVSIET